MTELSSGSKQQFKYVHCNPVYKKVAKVVAIQVKRFTSFEPTLYEEDGNSLGIMWKTPRSQLLCTLQNMEFIVRNVKTSHTQFYKTNVENWGEVAKLLVYLIDTATL